MYVLSQKDRGRVLFPEEVGAILPLIYCDLDSWQFDPRVVGAFSLDLEKVNPSKAVLRLSAAGLEIHLISPGPTYEFHETAELQTLWAYPNGGHPDTFGELVYPQYSPAGDITPLQLLGKIRKVQAVFEQSAPPPPPIPPVSAPDPQNEVQTSTSTAPLPDPRDTLKKMFPFF